MQKNHAYKNYHPLRKFIVRQLVSILLIFAGIIAHVTKKLKIPHLKNISHEENLYFDS